MAQDAHVLNPHFERKSLGDLLITPSGTTMQRRLGDLLAPGAGTGGLPVGTGPGTVAAGDDARIAGAQNAAQVAAAAASAVAAEAAARAAADAALYPASNPAGFIAAGGAPVQSVAGRTGAVTLGVTDVSGAYPSANPAGFVTAAQAAAAAPLQSVAGLAGAPTTAQLAAALAGTGAGTLAAGNDTRITGAQTAAQVSSAIAAGTAANVSGTVALANGGTGATTAPAARTALGLGGSAVLNVGTGAGTVAAGDDSRITGALPAATAALTYAPLASPVFTLAGGNPVRINLNAGSPAILPGATLSLTGADGAGSVLVSDTFGGTPTLIFRRANGTGAAPTALASGDVLSDVQARGYGATGYATTSRSWVRQIAAAAWTDASQPTALLLGTTPVNGTSVAERMRVQPSGNVTIGTTADDGASLLQVAGTAAAQDLNVAGTGGVAGAWAASSPAPLATTGTLTTASGSVRVKKFGRTVFFSVSLTITTNGTGAGQVIVALPFAAAANEAFGGRDFSNGKSIVGVITPGSTTLTLTSYDGSYPAVSGSVLVISGVYEANT